MERKFRAIMIEEGGAPSIRELLVEDLMEGDVVLRVESSTLNYKDGLALTGKAPVVRRWPMIPGIDLAGVVESGGGGWKEGDRALVNGWGLGEKHYGGYAGKARVRSEWLTSIPERFDSYDATAIGTAGYTAMLCVMALERGGVKSGSGEVLVTGASGGVGSVAVMLLSSLGYEVTASTGRMEEEGYLRGLGAKLVEGRDSLTGKVRALDKERFAGVVDCVGSTTLANALSRTRYGGVVAACGLAGGMDLPTSVAPFILRGITLAGVDSVTAPSGLREEAWGRLSEVLDLEKLGEARRDVGLEEVMGMGEEILLGRVRGRTVVRVE